MSGAVRKEERQEALRSSLPPRTHEYPQPRDATWTPYAWVVYGYLFYAHHHRQPAYVPLSTIQRFSPPSLRLYRRNRVEAGSEWVWAPQRRCDGMIAQRLRGTASEVQVSSCLGWSLSDGALE